MHITREAAVGIGTGSAFFAGVVALGAASGSMTLRVFSVLAGLGGGSAVGVFAALAAHLAGRPAGYAPLDASWGEAEVEAEQAANESPSNHRPRL